MSEKEKNDVSKKPEVSRRQFLTYTLMGVGGFLASSLLVPMVRFAIDPALKAAGEAGDLVAVADVSELTNEPKNVTFKVKTVDGWYNTQSTMGAWVYKEGEDIIPLSPICTHLGCTVQWNTSPANPEHFYCPCHGGLYTKEGVNIPGTPPPRPLDVYAYEVRDGKLYLGKAAPRESL